jgi:hypothetical protein
VRIGALVLAAVIAACGGGPIRVEVPESASASRIIVVERGSGSGELAIVEVLAVAGSDDRAPSVIQDYRVEERVRVTVLSFERTLDELGLVAGPLSMAETGVRLRDLSPGAIIELEVAGGTASAWAGVATLDARIADHKVVRASVVEPGCVELRALNSTIPAHGGASFAYAMNDDEAYVGVQAYFPPEHVARLAVVHRDGTVRDITPSSILAPGDAEFPVWSALRESEDVVWFGGDNGALWRVRIGPDLVPIEVLERHVYPGGSGIRWLRGRAAPGATEVFLRTVHGDFARFDGASFETLHEFRRDPRADWRGGLVARSGEAWAVSNLNSYVAHYKASTSTVTLEYPSSDRMSGLTGIGEVEGLGIVVGNSESNIYLYTEDRGWTSLGDSNADVGADTFIEAPGGFFYGARLGTIGQWRREGGYCSIPPSLTGQSMRFFTPLKGGAFVGTGPSNDHRFDLPFTIFEPKR